jgi:hypothetical protein
MSLEAVFVRAGARWNATELGRGPWDPRALHGGAPAALLVHAFEATDGPPDLQLARITYELVRPVPLGALEVSVEVLKPGRRVVLLEGAIRDGHGREVSRARALKLPVTDEGEPDDRPPPFPGPGAGSDNDFDRPDQPMFATDAMEIRFVEGSSRERGPATAWFRLRHPLVAGEPISPMERVAVAGDFGNGISTVLSWRDHTFINPDLTLYVERQPRGEWVALQAQTRVHRGSVAVAESVLWDEHGRIGRAIQTLLISRR